MPHIDLYAAHGLDRSATSAELAATLTAQLDSVDQYDTVNRGRVETARAILGDTQRRATYDGLLSDPAAHIDERVLASIASGAPTLQHGDDQLTPGAYPAPSTLPQAAYRPASDPYPAVPTGQQFRQSTHVQSGQPQQRVVHVVVVPDGIMPKAEFWADQWSIEMSPDGSAIRLVGTGKGSAAKKAARKTGDVDWAWVAGGAIGGLFF